MTKTIIYLFALLISVQTFGQSIKMGGIRNVRLGNPPVQEEPPPEEEDYGTLLYSSSFETQEEIENEHNQLGFGSRSTTQKMSGEYSFKSLVNASSTPISSGYRSEVQYDAEYSQDGDETVTEYYVFYESLPASVEGGLAVQWHGNAPGTSGQNSLWINGGEFMVMRSVQSGVNIYQSGCACGGGNWSIETGKWYYHRWEIKYTSGTDGYVKLYIDDDITNGIADAVLYYDSGIVKTSDGTGQYPKIGQNLWDAPSNNSVMYYDNLKFWKRD